MKKTPSIHDNLTTIVFDWGNTLMKVFPQVNGPMSQWPEVAVIDGVHDTLQELHKKYHLILASNAADSSSLEVKKALSRVNIDEYFSQILVSNEMGSSKPEPMFFQSVLSAFTGSTEEVIHIGDTYQNDILPAHLAGWDTVWFNPDLHPAPGLLPMQTAELFHMKELPKVLQSRRLPDVDTCLTWLLQRDASSLLLAHVHSVAAIACQLALWLRQAGENASPLLAHRGGLLHDIAKISSNGSDIDHGRLGAEILRDYKQPELAQISMRHPLFCIMDENRIPFTWEQKAVYLADKLVEGSQICTLEERLQALQNRYPKHAERIRHCSSAITSLMEEFCKVTGKSVSSLHQELEQALRTV